jgi:hypothetical protein
VFVKGSSTNIGPVYNILNRNGIIATFIDQANQGFLQQFARALNAPVHFGHEDPLPVITETVRVRLC